MSLVVRVVKNSIESPLVDAQGQLLVDARLSFRLVDRYGRFVRNVADAISQETIATPPVTVFTDADGVFVVPLWPTSRGANSYYYHVRGCTIAGREIVNFTAPLPDGGIDLAWADFLALAGLWQDAHNVTAGAVVLTDTPSGKSFELGVAIDEDTQQPVPTFKETL